MLIAIPSKSRAGKTTSQKIMKEHGVFFVPESELHQYEGTVKNLRGVPSDVKGITPTRNWILKNTDERRVVFLDDDVKRAGYIKMMDEKSRPINVHDEEVWINEFNKWFDICDQLGYKIWGARTEASPRGVHPFRPILFKTYVTASCMGIINDGEYLFDEDFVVKEDYEICLRHIRDKGGILGVRYIYWENSHWEDEGGCKNYRTVEVEKDAIKRLIRKYPGMVRSAKRKANIFTIALNF